MVRTHLVTEPRLVAEKREQGGQVHHPFVVNGGAEEQSVFDEADGRGIVLAERGRMLQQHRANRDAAAVRPAEKGAQSRIGALGRVQGKVDVAVPPREIDEVRRVLGRANGGDHVFEQLRPRNVRNDLVAKGDVRGNGPVESAIVGRGGT